MSSTTDSKPVGRPLKFESVDALQPLIDQYFEVTPDSELTITGLAVHLDTDRTTLINYENRDEFFDAIKRAKNKIEASYEKSLRLRGSAGDIFGLKNFGWSDKYENANTNDNNNLNLDIADLNDSEVDDFVAGIKSRTAKA